ncbi:hypothetical protein J4Q44_G00121650 [Coregonus suidteri]|uniref:Ig-like domain-containing protein n=1 Tax=Coregonus suidteri TaxID=861788 RepID=A0AAN8M1Q0_9TELE
MIMGPLCFSRPPRILALLLVATLAGGILSLCLVCDGATLPNPTQDAAHTEGPVADTMAVTELSEPGSETENTSLSTDVPNDVPVEEDGLVVEEGVVEEWGLVVQQQPDKEKAMAGDDVVFSCLLSGGDPEGMGVQWVVHGHKERHTILEGNQMSKDAFAGRAFLSGNPTAGDFSMMLRNVSRVDRGIYHCLLTPHNGGEWDQAQHP